MAEMNQKELRRYLSVIKRAVSYIESMLDNDDGGLMEQLVMPAQPVAIEAKAPVALTGPAPVVQQVVPPVIQEEPPVAEVKGPTPEEVKAFEAARKKHISDLMAIDCWPEAVPAFLVAKDASTEDQVNRANAVLDMMLDKNVEGTNFLDFGCGEGWIAQEALKRGVVESVGYDKEKHETWAKLKGVKTTNDYASLKRGHFDVVMLYDVLDHAHDPMEVMAQVKHVLKKDGSVYVRCHPWTSKHATHLYKQGVNKAYLHLFLRNLEIGDMINADVMFTREEKNAMEAYHWWFNNYEIKKERFVREPVGEFFFVPAFKELLANEQQIPVSEIDNFLKLMEVQFIDYVLTPKK
jgi:SAM-dependent methyltransferase